METTQDTLQRSGPQYIMVPDAVINDRTISLEARLTYCILASYADDKTDEPATEYVARAQREFTPEMVSGFMEELRHAGWITGTTLNNKKTRQD